MAPGKRKTRSTLIDESSNTSQQVNRITRSTIPTEQASQQQEVRITRSNVHVLPPRPNYRTTRSTIHSDPPAPPPPDVSIPSPIVQSQQAASAVDSDVGHNVSQTPSESSGPSIRKTRGPTRGRRTSYIAENGKLPVVFEAECRQPICDNSEKFNNEVGFIVRNHGTFHYKDWRFVPEEVRAPLRHFLLDTFDIDLHDETTIKCIDDQMRKSWKNFKYKLHGYFKEIGGEEELEMAKRRRHPDLKDDRQQDWEMLCDRWFSDEFKERSLKNTANRSKRKWESRNGSVSTARHHIRRGILLTSSTGQIETWRLKHFDEKNGTWTGPDVSEIYDKMMELRSQHTPEEMTDKDIMERILGRSSAHLKGWGRSNSSTSNSQPTRTQSTRPTYEELAQRLDSQNDQLSVVIEILRKNNMMPPPPSDQCSDAHVQNSPLRSVQDEQDDS